MAQVASINGTMTVLPGREARLVSISDPISKTEIILDIDTIDQKGTFTLNSEIKETQMLWMVINRYKAPIFLEPTSQLRVSVDPEPKYKLADSWLKGSFEYEFPKPDRNGINEIISKFDGAYYYFFLVNAQYMGTSTIKTKIEEFESSFSSLGGENVFASQYIRYSIAEMKLSNGFNKMDVYKEYIENDQIYIDNPGWFSFFNSFYSDYFNSYDIRFGGESIYNQLNQGIDIDSLNHLLDKDQYLSRPDIKQTALLLNLSDAFADKRFDKVPLWNILKSILEKPESPINERIAKNLKNKWTKFALPYSLEEIKNQFAKRLPISKDTIPTLLITSLSGGPQLLKDIAILEKLMEKYPGVFKVLEVHIGPNYSSRSREWSMTQIDMSYEYLSEFEIYSIPHYMWFNKKGKLIENPVLKPSEGLETKIYEINSQHQEENKIKVGQ